MQVRLLPLLFLDVADHYAMVLTVHDTRFGGGLLEANFASLKKTGDELFACARSNMAVAGGGATFASFSF
jgi:hypothetical protein